MKKLYGSLRQNRLAALALAMCLVFILSCGVRSASAYLTSHASTQGYVALELKDTWTDLDEDVANWEKRITIMNDGEAACKVRVKLFAGQSYLNYIKYYSNDTAWSLDPDGYWYYDGILEPGQSTTELMAKLDSAMFSNDFIEAGTEDFNIIVVHEYARVQYDNLGRPFVDWNEKAVAE